MMLGSEATGLTADMTSTLLEEIQAKGVLGIDALAEEPTLLMVTQLFNFLAV